eukprot:3905875-Amphidinium_carterae.1
MPMIRKQSSPCLRGSIVERRTKERARTMPRCSAQGCRRSSQAVSPIGPHTEWGSSLLHQLGQAGPARLPALKWRSSGSTHWDTGTPHERLGVLRCHRRQ